MTQIVAAHSSGKWSQTSAPAFDANVRRMRRGRDLVSRTEATANAFNREITWPGDGWGYFHPRDGIGHDCSVEWNLDDWDVLDTGVLQLTDFRVTTAESHTRLQPCSLTWALLVNRHSRGELEFGAAHLDLLNTAARRRANLEECNALRAHYRESHQKHPHRNHLLQMDGNRNQRDKRWRAYFVNELMGGTDLRSGWHTPLPPQGTHGKHLLDVSVADFAIKSKILLDDASSDHRPYETTGRINN